MDSEKRCNGGNRSQLSPELKAKLGQIREKWFYDASGKIRDGYHKQLNLECLDKLIEWKIYRWAEARDKVRNGQMQDQVTIECQMDFTDKDKMQEVIKLACSTARTLAANIQLLDPVCKPQCVVYTDNFMSPPEKINIYQDLIGKGNEELQETEGISSELLNAVTGDGK